MKAIVQHRYGSPDVLALEEIDKPEPREGEVLLRVHASAVNQADWIALTGRPYAARLAFGLVRPKRRIPGLAVAGRVAVVGRSVTQFAPGDDVFTGTTRESGAPRAWSGSASCFVRARKALRGAHGREQILVRTPTHCSYTNSKAGQLPPDKVPRSMN